MSLRLLLSRTNRLCHFQKPSRIIIEQMQRRCIQTSSFDLAKNKTFQEMKQRAVEKRKEVRSFFLQKYVDYVFVITKLLQQSFPKALAVYKVFTLGIQEFFKDCKQYIKIQRLLQAHHYDFTRITRKEIELYEQLPKDMRKIAPVLIIALLPFTVYVIIPLVYLFPRQLLTSHFWTIQQKFDYELLYLKKRLKHNRPALRNLQEQIEYLRGTEYCETWASVLGKIGSGQQAEVKDIVSCKKLFEAEPYHLLYLRPQHIRHLMGIHGLNLGFFRRERLKRRAQLLLEMDKAIKREGDVHNLTLDSLKHACYLRGLNPHNMTKEDMVNWMRQWLILSENTDNHSLSLILHAPMLLGYNEPSNWRVIYSKV